MIMESGDSRGGGGGGTSLTRPVTIDLFFEKPGGAPNFVLRRAELLAGNCSYMETRS